MRYSMLLLCMYLITGSSCNNATGDSQPATAYKKLEQAAWLLGHWRHADRDGNATEIWTRTNDSALYAESFIVKGTDTVFYETIKLEEQAETVYYTVSVKNQNNELPVAFKMTSTQTSPLVFENKEHDFPTKIVYHKIGEDSLFAEVSGIINGKEVKESFPFKKQ